ncbi:transaldolase [Biformimicrobium ophioploci]|uniref:Transaldolase n=1 Tax=Biformimicrobium ophioploci TaxID=3036711 RepID=A0ABQ6LZ03_9GAMM|nr:transaldolase [Microbulbifer sp. NKW57]GMG87301.1 transaldolase [Microbulbifer sp. NKW57]
MNKLEQLRQYSLVVADTGDIDAIARFKPQDATTNPSLLLKAAQLPLFKSHMASAIAWAKDQRGDTTKLAVTKLSVEIGCEILQLVPGYVSTEVDAHLSFDTEGSLAKARQLIGLYEEAGISRDRVLIKLASTWEGIRAAEILEKEGIHCNLTLLFSFCQARACADAGVTLISPFVGRILDWYKKSTGRDSYPAQEDPGVLSVQKIYRYYKARGCSTIVMGASFRNTGEIEALAGCDRLTISPQLLDELAQDSGTLERQLVDEGPSGDAAEAPLTEAEFRLQLNDDAMATEKLAEGIRNFIADQEKLEALIQEQIDSNVAAHS